MPAVPCWKWLLSFLTNRAQTQGPIIIYWVGNWVGGWLVGTYQLNTLRALRSTSCFNKPLSIDSLFWRTHATADTTVVLPHPASPEIQRLSVDREVVWLTISSHSFLWPVNFGARWGGWDSCWHSKQKRQIPLKYLYQHTVRTNK